MSGRESLLQRFRELHDYVGSIGEHVNQIHSRLDGIEKKIGALTREHNSFVESTKVELESIGELITTKSELEELLLKMNNAIKGALPVLHDLASELLHSGEIEEKVEGQIEEKVEGQIEEKVEALQGQSTKEVK
ncbi:MAG: hypothetical protein QG670_1210, partial [Thermoproteota archaeon]|nr:hypothetical protein [Thermoproteota archaeon]